MITIYWSINTQVIPEGLRVLPPVPIKNKLFEDRIRSKSYGQELLYDKCPALGNELTNLYGMKSVYDYNLEIDAQGKTEYSSEDDLGAISNEDFFNQHVMVRSLAGRLFSFIQGLVFFTDARSLIMSQLPAFMEDNNIMKNTILIPGQFDIGKYFRILDMAWHFRDGCNRIEFNREEISFYLKFHTKEKIKFQRFLFTDELVDLSGAMFRTKGSDGHSSKLKYDALKYYYNIFDKYNFKNKMLKIIKENLCKEEDLEGEVVK